MNILLEEYVLTIINIKEHNNDAVDALIRLPLINSDVTEREITRESLAESYCYDKLYRDTFPLTYLMIDKNQHKDKNLTEKLKCANYHTKYFCNGGNT